MEYVWDFFSVLNGLRHPKVVSFTDQVLYVAYDMYSYRLSLKYGMIVRSY